MAIISFNRQYQLRLRDDQLAKQRSMVSKSKGASTTEDESAQSNKISNEHFYFTFI